MSAPRRTVHRCSQSEVDAGVSRELGLDGAGSDRRRLPFSIAVHTVRLNHPRNAAREWRESC